MRVLLGIALASAGAWGGEPVKVFRNVIYVADSEDPRQRLDIYLPAQVTKRTPVLVMVHGGAWISGGKGLMASGARALSELGVLAVSVDYRLSPTVRHPVHANDLRAAVAWVEKQAEKYGFDPKRIFLLGHSAGAHLSASLATDSKGLGDGVPAGVISLAGIFDIPTLDKKFPGYDSWFLTQTFGPRGPAWKEASPIAHPQASKAKWLLFNGGNDTLIDADQSSAFAAHLRKQGLSAETKLFPKLDHESIVSELGSPEGELVKAILNFLRQ